MIFKMWQRRLILTILWISVAALIVEVTMPLGGYWLMVPCSFLVGWFGGQKLVTFCLGER